jgi:hypothetical protein
MISPRAGRIVMKLLFVGDVLLGRPVNQVLKSKMSAYPWQ